MAAERGRRVWAVAGSVIILGIAVGLVGCGSASTGDAATTATDRPESVTTGASTKAGTTIRSTTTAPPTPSSITMAFAGDLLPHSAVSEAAASYGREANKPYDFAPMLAPMAPILGPVDVAICHLEVPVAPTPDRVAGYPVFGAPPELVDGARSAGYDGCSTASNHTLDQGRTGVDATLARFDQQKLGHAGSARTEAEGGRIQIYDLKGVRVAHLSYAYGFNGYTIPADAPWLVNQIDPARIRADARRAREAGADLVVVSLHWGTEYVHEPSAYQRDIADQLLPSPDIDLIVGHHAHVVQPISRVDGTWVVWGLGNQLSNMTQDIRRDGLTAVLTAGRGDDGRWRITRVDAVPTWQELGTFRVLPVVRTLGDPALPAGLRSDLEASYERTAAVLRTGDPAVQLAPLPG